MNTLTRVSIWGFVALVLPPAIACGQTESPAATDTTAESPTEQIRRLIPFATAMPHNTLEVIARMDMMPKFDALGDQSVTSVLMFYTPDDRKAAQKHFRPIKGMPKPSELAGEMRRTFGGGRVRIPLMPCTLIHANRITKFTCEVNELKATGTVAFRVPDLYEGEIQYVAARKGNDWQIERFLLPGYGLDVIRTADGWKAERRDKAADAGKAP